MDNFNKERFKEHIQKNILLWLQEICFTSLLPKKGIYLTMSEYNNQKKLDPDEYYLSEERYVLFTEKSLLKRGHCCQNACKHYPYGLNKKTGRIEIKIAKKNSFNLHIN